MDPAHPDARALRTQLESVAPLPAADWKALLAQSRAASVERGGHVCRPGDPAEELSVVLEGLVRHYYVDGRGRESVKAFRGPGEVSAPYAEIIQRRASRSFIQALVPTRLLVFRVAQVEALAEHSVALQRLLRRLVELHFVAKEQREYEFLQLSAEERYRQFCRERPEHLAEIPLHQVASYIGITPVALSRIRARVGRTSRRAP
jgi:CRP-like cAMP-binding protein